jgi:hypothetical protein
MKRDRARPGDKAEDKVLPVAASSRPFLYYLVDTAMVCCALVMVIEILGVIGPFFGASLFVWTSLITMTLVA